MAQQLSKEQIIALAQLAKLKLSDEEVDRYQHELSEILSYVEQLASVDTAAFEPTYQVSGLQNVMRDDEVVTEQPASPDQLMSLPPKTKNGFIQVGRMI